MRTFAEPILRKTTLLVKVEWEARIDLVQIGPEAVTDATIGELLDKSLKGAETADIRTS